jgi:hypothetical protein
MLSGMDDVDYSALSQSTAAMGMGAAFAGGFGSTPESWERQQRHSHADEDED